MCSRRALLAFTIFFYAVVYTMWLKRSTPQNIVIGGLAGALPPAIAWAAKAGSLSIDPMMLVPSSSSGRRRTSGRCRSAEERLRRREGADAAGDARRQGDPPADFPLFAVARAACGRRQCSLGLAA
jgi:hypothetical protein